MIYSIGYERLDPAELLRLANRLDATVVDVRGSHRRTRAGYSEQAMRALLGERYDWRPTTLGNAGGNHVQASGLEALYMDPGNAILLCVEEAAGDCHRYSEIAVPLLEQYGEDVRHIYRGQVARTSAMLRAYAENTPCEMEELA